MSKDTILIGHSLEADLRALRLVHEKIIDTSVLFACNNKKRSLKHLAYELLGRDIQQLGGHDSTEDAKTCIQLLAHKMDSEEGREIPEEVKEIKLDPNFNHVYKAPIKMEIEENQSWKKNQKKTKKEKKNFFSKFRKINNQQYLLLLCNNCPKKSLLSIFIIDKNTPLISFCYDLFTDFLSFWSFFFFSYQHLFIYEQLFW